MNWLLYTPEGYGIFAVALPCVVAGLLVLSFYLFE